MAEDITPEVIKKTQKLLGKYVKKPALTEKLLKKPPFRFLHDIVVAVIKDTGFLKGLFSAEELLSENIKDKEAKVAFLNKLIEAVKTITKADLTVRASKIVAGLEPTKTNLLLQAVGKALDDKTDSSAYIAQLNSGQKEATEKKKVKKSTPIKEDKGKTSKTKNKDDPNTKTTRTKKSTESPRSNSKTSTPKESSRGVKKVSKASKNESVKQASIEEETRSEISKQEVVTENATTSNAIIDGVQIEVADNLNMLDDHTTIDSQNDGKDIVKAMENQSKNSINLEVTNKEQKDAMNQNVNAKEIKNDTQNLARPKSARPKNVEASTLKPKKLNVDENEAPKTLQMTASQVQRPKSSLRPPTVRPSSARPGAPRLRPDSALPVQENVMMGNINVIIENVDNMDDEETVVIQTTSDVVEENFAPTNLPLDNKGQLVEQILEQIQGEDGEGVKKKVDIDWEQDALHINDGTAKEINQLRSLIQTLTKTANPLGKLLNYLHEDIEAMYAELQMWKNIKKQLYTEIYKQQRNNDEVHKNLEIQLDALHNDTSIYEHNVKVSKKNVLRNEMRIKELLAAQLSK